MPGGGAGVSGCVSQAECPLSSRISLRCFTHLFDLLNEHGKIRALKAHIWGRNAVMLDVGWNVLVVRQRRGQRRIFRVGKIIVPIQALVAPIDFVPMRDYMRPASKSTSSRMRSRRSLVNATSPSAMPVYGLSDQTATVELLT